MMPTASSVRPSPRRRRGVSLIEALVAMAVMAFGMLAVVGVQATLRMNADIAKQRSEATRIAEEEIERLRAFRDIGAVAGAPPGWAEIDTQTGTAVPMVVANTSYTIDRNVVTPAGSPQKVVTVAVNWQDRYGNAQSVVLRNVIAGAAPVLSGLVSVPPSRTAPSLRKSRHPTIPVRARELGGSGSGESVFKPSESGTVAWTFNDVTGVITRVCTVAAATSSASLTAADLGANCLSTAAQLLSGTVGFNLRGASRDLGNGISALKPVAAGTVAWAIDNVSHKVTRNCQVTAASTTATLGAGDVADGPACVSVDEPVAPFDPASDPTLTLLAADSEQPGWPALPLSIDLVLTSSGHAASPVCFTNAPTNSLAANQSRQTAVEYFCIVFPNTAKTWSGQSLVVAGAFVDGGAATWTIGTGSADYRVCRYTLGAAPAVNSDHPLNYADASGNLVHQNFLVVAGPKNCPSDVVANPASGDLVDSNTLPHQPS